MNNMETSTQIIDHVLAILGAVLMVVAILFLLFALTIQSDEIKNLTKRHDSYVVCHQMIEASDVNTFMDYKNKFNRCVKLLTEKEE